MLFDGRERSEIGLIAGAQISSATLDIGSVESGSFFRIFFVAVRRRFGIIDDMEMSSPRFSFMQPARSVWSANLRVACALAIAILIIFGGPSGEVLAATAVATYELNNTFAADQTGAPALTAVDPTGTSQFQTDLVLGQVRPAWFFNGTNLPAQQSGLTLNTTGLLPPQSFSIDLVCQFTAGANAWRRLIDVQNRSSDSGFYVDPNNNLDIFPVSGSSAAWTNNVYHHIVLTDDGAQVNAYLDGVSQFSAATTILNLDADPTNNPDRLLGFFLDNTAGGGQGEWSPGSVALVRVWSGVLTSAEAQALANNPFAVPEPSSVVLCIAGAGVMGWFGCRRFRKA